MRKDIWIGIAIAALSLASCTKVGDPSGPSGAVVFAAAVEDLPGVTRAVGEIGSLAADGVDFGVFAYDTGHYLYEDSSVNPNFMYNERISYSVGRWSYSPIKYWPNGDGAVDGNSGERPDYVSFFAYAPYSDLNPGNPSSNPAGYCISSFIDQGDAGNPWLVYRISQTVANQVDLLYAPSLPDLTKPDVEGVVQFNFKHALACVGERVNVGASLTLKSALAAEAASSGATIQVLLQSVTVTYHLTEKARLSLWNNGSANWMPLLNGTIMTDREVVYGSWNNGYPVLYSTDPSDTQGAWISDGDNGVFYIPLDVEGNRQSATITVDYIIRRIEGGIPSDTPEQREATIFLCDYPAAFQPGKKILTLSIALQPS